MNVALVTSILILAKIEVRAYDIRVPFYNRRPLSINSRLPIRNLALQHHIQTLQEKCYIKNLLYICPVNPMETTSNMTNIAKNYQTVTQDQPRDISKSGNEITTQHSSNINQSPIRRMMDHIVNSNMISSHLRGKLDGLAQNMYPISTTMSKLNMKLDGPLKILNDDVQITTELSNYMINKTNLSVENLKDGVTTAAVGVQNFAVGNSSHGVLVLEKFSQSLDSFERKFYATTFSKLSLVSPASRRENGMSFAQSGLFLQLALMTFATELGPETRREIDNCLELDLSDQERLDLINATLSSLPASSDDLKLRWSSRLVLRSQNVSERFRADAAPALRLQIESFNGTETPKEMADALNHMVEIDSGGAIHNTFEEDELSADVRAVLVSTLYLRARWRSAPTLLNGTRAFKDAGGPRRAARVIRLNDIMRYARLDHWDAEALEIYYSTPGLSLLILVPRGSSLRQLAAAAANTSLSDITAKMQPLRVAATLPLYTLRMTLLLPNKLQAMNISRLVTANNGSGSELRLSLAVQRIMFWAEAGRNAFKDDGLEWDEPPQHELVVDRPYIFYVRWKNKTIMNGNFVL